MKQWQINKVYNDGILKILKKEAVKDEYNTTINNEYKDFRRCWYRNLNCTSNEILGALQVDTKISRKVAISLSIFLKDDINSNLIIKIDDKNYNIFRVFHNERRNETEITLTEVIYE